MTEKKFNLKLVKPALIDQDKNNIFFVHIPKCGGTTIDHAMLRYSISKNNIIFIRSKNYENDNINQIKDDKKVYFSGHLNENTLDKFKDKKFKKITIIRNPLERVVSQYKFTIFKKKISLNEYKLETFLKEQKDN